MSNVKQLRTRGFIRPEPAAALRQIADDIEAGLFGKVEAVAVANAKAIVADHNELAALRALLDACAPYLKEGETPAERIERERKDVTAMVGALARERTLLDQARKGLAEQAEVTSRVIAVITYETGTPK